MSKILVYLHTPTKTFEIVQSFKDLKEAYMHFQDFFNPNAYASTFFVRHDTLANEVSIVLSRHLLEQSWFEIKDFS